MRVLRNLMDAAELDGAANELRIERLTARLADGALAVRDTVVRAGGRRVELQLDDGSTLSLRLFWPRRDNVAALSSVRWDDQVGWVVVVRTAGGERVIDYAWLATLSPAS